MARNSSEYNGKKPFVLSERNVSILILLMLFITAAAVLVSQNYYSLEKFGIKESSSSSQKGKAPVDIPQISLAPENYKALTDWETFDEETLYEKINGKAPIYLSSGYESLMTRRFVRRGKTELWFEIFFYKMGSLENAFSVYSRQRRIGASVTEHLYTYETKNTQTFVRGEYYVEINGAREDADLLKAIRQAGAKARKALGAKKEVPLLKVFSKKHLVPGSEKLYLASAFGFKGFKDLYAANYKSGEEKTTVFFYKTEGNEETAGKYIDFLKGEDAVEKKVQTEVPNLRLIDFDGYIEIFFKTGHFTGGVHEGYGVRESLSIAEMLYRDITKYEKEHFNGR